MTKYSKTKIKVQPGKKKLKNKGRKKKTNLIIRWENNYRVMDLLLEQSVLLDAFQIHDRELAGNLQENKRFIRVRKAKDNVRPLLKKEAVLVTEDAEKAELLLILWKSRCVLLRKYVSSVQGIRVRGPWMAWIQLALHDLAAKVLKS